MTKISYKAKLSCKNLNDFHKCQICGKEITITKGGGITCSNCMRKEKFK